MMDWAAPAIPHLKALHIAALAFWCGGLFALPLMLARHDPAIGPADFTRIRLATHYGYVFAVTPAALVAIASGTLLFFLRDLFLPWMFAKLVAVALLVAFHAWVGAVVVAVADTTPVRRGPDPRLPLLLLLLPVLAILTLVLAKPDVEHLPMPDWLSAPRGGQLPFFDVPSR